MKINSISLISIASLLTCASANAGVMADFYVGAMGGIGGQTTFSDGKHKTEAAQMVGAIAGMDLPIFRVEAEYDYLRSNDLKTNAALVNLYAKMPSTIILPYIGGGIGMVFGGENTVDSVKYDIKATSAYQAMLGATIDILAIPLKFDVEGRILYAPDIYKIDATGVTPDMLQYGVRAKARFIF